MAKGKLCTTYENNKKCFTVRGIMMILGLIALIVGFIINNQSVWIPGIAVFLFFGIMFSLLFK